jgi:hypothetical protein
MEIPGLTLLLSDPSRMSIDVLGSKSSPEAGDTNHPAKSFSAQADVRTDPPTMDKTDTPVLEVVNLSIPSKRALEESQDSEDSKRQKTIASAPPAPVKPVLTIGLSLSVPPEIQRNNDSQAPEAPSSETLTKTQRKKLRRRLRLEAQKAALVQQSPVQTVQGADVLREPAAQQAALTVIPTNTTVAPIAAIVPPSLPVVPPTPPVVLPTPPVVPPTPPITPPVVSLSLTHVPISTETWLGAGIPKSPFNNSPYSRQQLETAWLAFNMAYPNIYSFPIQSLVIVRFHFLSTLWRYSNVRGTHYVTTPRIGGIGIEAMRFLTHHLGCPIVQQTKTDKYFNYIMELKYVPPTSRGGKGFKFLENALNVEAEKAALTSLEKAWKVKLAWSAVQDSAQTRTMQTTAHQLSQMPTSQSNIPILPTAQPQSAGGHDSEAKRAWAALQDSARARAMRTVAHQRSQMPTPRRNIPRLPTAQPQSVGGHDYRTAESRLAELKSQLVQAKAARQSSPQPDKSSRAASPPVVSLPMVRIPRRKAADFFDYIVPKRPELQVPEEKDDWGKLNY